MSLRCLVVDDNCGFRQAVQVLLEQEGLRVIGTASTGAEAARQVAVLRPDVTLVDVDLGEESGFDVVRRLAEDPVLDPGGLILISAHAEEDLADLIAASPPSASWPRTRSAPPRSSGCWTAPEDLLPLRPLFPSPGTRRLPAGCTASVAVPVMTAVQPATEPGEVTACAR